MVKFMKSEKDSYATKYSYEYWTILNKQTKTYVRKQQKDRADLIHVLDIRN